MATRYYGCAVGARTAKDVTEAGSTNSTTFEFVTVYTDTGVNKAQTLMALEAIKQAILQDTFPPA